MEYSHIGTEGLYFFSDIQESQSSIDSNRTLSDSSDEDKNQGLENIEEVNLHFC